MSTPAITPDQIEGLPPGAVLKRIDGLPPGATLRAIKDKGGLPTQPAPVSAPAPPEEGFWHSLGSQVKAVLNPDILFSASPVPNPQTAVELAGNFTTAMQQAKAPISPKTGLPFPDPTGALRAGHTAAALLTPIGGGIIEKGLEQLESGNVKGAAGTAVGAALPFAAGRLLHPKAPMPAAEVLPRHVEALTGLIEDRAGTVDPHATATDALPHLRETAVRMRLDPSRLEGREAGQATLKVAEQAVRDVQNEFNAIRKPYNAVLVDQTPVAQAYLDALTPELMQNEPHVAMKLLTQADKFAQLARNPDGVLLPRIASPRPVPLEQVNQFRVRMNNQLNAFEQRGTTAQIMSDVETKASKAAANAARDVEYQTVGQMSGLDPEYVRSLKQREGALIEAKTSLTKRYNEASGGQGRAVSRSVIQNPSVTNVKAKASGVYPSHYGVVKAGVKATIAPKPIDLLNEDLRQMFSGMGSAEPLPSYEEVQPPMALRLAGEDLVEEARRGGPGIDPEAAKEAAASRERAAEFLRQKKDNLAGQRKEVIDKAADIRKELERPAAPQTVAGGQITPEHVAAENAFYTQARAELGADASPSAVLARAQALKVEHAAKAAPPPVTPANPPKPPTLTQKMAARPLPKLRRVEPPRTGAGAAASAYQPSPAVQASLIMLQAKQGLITPAEADSRIQRLVGSGGRRTIRRPVGPE